MKTLSVTVDDIMKMNPCDRYTRESIEALRKSVCGRRKRITGLDILDADISRDDKLWLILREDFIPARTLHEIAIWCWEAIAMPIWDKHYADDKRPHEAVRIKRLWLDGKATNEELDAARAAAMDAARDAARAAAWDTASYAAMDAARAAASYAARAAARDAARAAILNHIREVL